MKKKLAASRLKVMEWVTALPPAAIIEAHALIDRGADIALLRLWQNLTTGQFLQVLNLKQVQQQATYYAEKQPEFLQDIIRWTQVYEELYKSMTDGEQERQATAAAE